MQHDPRDAGTAAEPTEHFAGERSRRAFLRAGAFGVTAAALTATSLTTAYPAGAGSTSTATPVRTPGGKLALTPACDGHETPDLVEGPVFKPNSPRRTNLITPANTGVRLSLSGVVYAPDCTPLSGVLLDFWQCDQNGDYDLEGFTLRGHQYTSRDGGYRLETIIPRDYWGRWGHRTAHIHVKAQAPGGPMTTTQLFFPDDTEAYERDFAAINAVDRIINRACTITLSAPGDGGYRGTFHFVVSTAA